MTKETSSARSRSQQLKRRRIFDSLMFLLQTHTIRDISIQDICDQAMIHRTTFYNHFYDVYDLISFGFNELTQELFPEDQLLHADIDSMAANIGTFIKKYHVQLKNLTLDVDYRQEMLRSTQYVFEEYVTKVLLENPSEYNLTIAPVKDMVKFYCAGLSELMLTWYQDTSLTVEEITEASRNVLSTIKNLRY